MFRPPEFSSGLTVLPSSGGGELATLEEEEGVLPFYFVVNISFTKQFTLFHFKYLLNRIFKLIFYVFDKKNCHECRDMFNS